MTNDIHHDVRRRADGHVDFDFYRREAAAMRRRALREAVALKTVRTALLAMAATFGVVMLLASTTPAPRGLAATVQTAAPQAW